MRDLTRGPVPMYLDFRGVKDDSVSDSFRVPGTRQDEWIWRQQETGSRVATVDILNYIQNELDYCGEEPCMSPRASQQHQLSQPVMHVNGSGFPVTTGLSGQTTVGRYEHCDNQSKNSVFSSASSNPVCQIGEEGNYSNGLSMGNGNLSTEPSFLRQQSQDSAAFSSNDSAMDMHAD
ncbi:hypothetical protein CR513_50151, partial [Mucuna pruriens]